MAAKVIVPNKHYSEFYFGVQFKNGVAVFEDEDRAKRIADRMGYEVEPIKADTKEDSKAAPKKAPAKRKAPAKKAAAKGADKKEG